MLAFKAPVIVTVLWLPITWFSKLDAAESVKDVTLAYADETLGTLGLVPVFTELETLELASPQATKVSVKTEVVTNLKIFFILKNHLLGTLYIIYIIIQIVFNNLFDFFY